MKDMWNVAFQNAWFGPFVIPNVYTSPLPKVHAGPVYNDGPMDGLIEASMHAQWFAQIPVVNAYQATPRMMGQACPAGQMLMRAPNGELKCVAAQPASAMIGGGAPDISMRTQRTFPVQSFYGFQD